VSTRNEDQLPSSVTQHYIKSNYFRVIHADGAIGGFTPRGEMFFSLFNERAPLPDVTVQAVENGKLGQEITDQRQGSQGIIRELEVGIVMDVNVAKSLVAWLEERIKVADQMRADAQVSRENEVKP
jgi:hypothetical protein